jgi:endogenous inhibitor of DNA gyrase (YacG/DUF329 family)
MSAEPAGPRTPLRHDAVTVPCPVCGTPFAAAGKRLYCSGACNAAAYRRRKRYADPPVVILPAQPRKPITVYECDACGTRALGQQRCEECGAFMRRVGLGGACPQCDEPVAVTDLLGEEVAR